MTQIFDEKELMNQHYRQLNELKVFNCPICNIVQGLTPEKQIKWHEERIKESEVKYE